MVPDTNDPECCLVPDCDNKNTTNIHGVQGTVTGTGTIPPPTQTPQGNEVSGIVNQVFFDFY